MFRFISPVAILFAVTRVEVGSVLPDGHGAALIHMLVKEGNDAILPCSFSSRNIRKDLFDWKKDKKDKKNKKDVFMYDQGTVHDEYEQFRGRVSHFPDDLEVGNASIRIRATKLTDSGNYTCDFPRLPPEERSNIELVVGASPKPSATILNGTTDWALLRCEVLGAFPKPAVHWQNRAGDLVPAEEPQVSERGGSYDITLQTTVNKTDHYRCVSTQKEINHQIYTEIDVLLTGEAPKPSVTILNATKDWALLRCVVRGAFPKPEVHWQNRAGDLVPAEEPHVSERGGSYDIILQTTVTKTDHYRCVSTPKKVNHQTHAETYVHLNGEAPKPSVTILNATKDWALLRCVVHGASPQPAVHWQNRAGDLVPAEEPQVSERGGSYDIILQTTVTKTDHYRCVSTPKKVNHQTHAETYVHLNGEAPKPSVTILNATKDWALLRCVVRGAFPKPEVHWQNRAGDLVPAEEPQVSERGGSYDIILQTTVTKTDHYRCVSTPKKVNHQTHAETYVHLNGSDADAGGTVPVWGAIVGAVLLALLVGVVVGVVVYFVQKKKKTYSAVPSNSDQAANGVHPRRQDQSDMELSPR